MARRRMLGRLPALAIVVAVLATVAASCAGSAGIASLDPSLQAYSITNDPLDVYSVALDDGAIVTRAGSDNTGGNSRLLFWPKAQEPSLDHEVCATWRSSSHEFRQEGLALRVRFDEGHGRALLITKNVWGHSYWVINVSTWRTGDAPTAINLLESFDLSDVITHEGEMVPLPWRICARAVGDQVSFVLWALDDDRPEWGDPRHSGTVTVPSDLVTPGVGGLYAGHILPDEEVTYDELTITVDPDPIDSSTTTTAPATTTTTMPTTTTEATDPPPGDPTTTTTGPATTTTVAA